MVSFQGNPRGRERMGAAMAIHGTIMTSIVRRILLTTLPTTASRRLTTRKMNVRTKS